MDHFKILSGLESRKKRQEEALAQTIEHIALVKQAIKAEDSQVPLPIPPREKGK